MAQSSKDSRYTALYEMVRSARDEIGFGSENLSGSTSDAAASVLSELHLVGYRSGVEDASHSSLEVRVKSPVAIAPKTRSITHFSRSTTPHPKRRLPIAWPLGRSSPTGAFSRSCPAEQ